jgi:hypothetical protein
MNFFMRSMRLPLKIGTAGSGVYIPACQLGFAAFKCGCAQGGLQVFAPFVHVEGEERLTPGVSGSCGRGSSNEVSE